MGSKSKSKSKVSETCGDFVKKPPQVTENLCPEWNRDNEFYKKNIDCVKDLVDTIEQAAANITVG